MSSNVLLRNTCATIAASLTFAAGQASALTISDEPLVSTTRVPNNIVVVLDDSGSMSFETVLNTNDGSLWFDTASDSYVLADGTLRFRDDIKSSYLFPYSEGPGLNGHRIIPPFVQYAFTRSSDYNSAYYNPDVDYQPWPDIDGFYDFEDADPTAAANDPTGRNSGRTYNLTQNMRLTGNNDRFHVHEGMAIPRGTVLAEPGENTFETENDDDEIWDGNNNDRVAVDFYPAVYYNVTDVGEFRTPRSADWQSCAGPFDPANYTAANGFEFLPSQFEYRGGTGDVVAIGPDGRCLERFTITVGTDEMQNFANWFEFSRKRHTAVRGGIIEAFNDLDIIMNVGMFTINNRNAWTMREFDLGSATDERNLFLNQVARERFGGGTPNRDALGFAGSRMDDYVEFQCQKNFAVFFTDGFSTLGGPNVGNADGGAGAPFADTFSNTFADIAFRYYDGAALGLTQGSFAANRQGEVNLPAGCFEPTTPDPVLDCNREPHMNTYAVLLNGQGRIYNTPANGFQYTTIQDAHDTPPTWPDSNADRDPTQIDDFYHAAVNSKGLVLNAASPDEVADRFSDALRDIAARSRSTTSLTAASTRLTTGSRLYQASFDASDWSGDLNAIDFDGTIRWSASEELPDEPNRNIFTSEPPPANGVLTGLGTEFEFADLTAAQKTAFEAQVTARFPAAVAGQFAGSSADAATALIGFLRGDQTCEVGAGGCQVFRQRSVLLGDIVNSEPEIITGSNEGWVRLPGSDGGGDSYVDFIDNTKQDNAEVVVVGANDGMLHGFISKNEVGDTDAQLDASTGLGRELFAFVPRALHGKLGALAEPNYSHQFYVDSSPRVADAYDGSSWRRILVGSAGAGARSVFALDVTDAESFDEGDVLWELTGDEEPDLGFSIGTPAITRLANGRWVAVIGNGYNSDDRQGTLIFTDLFTGEVIRKLTTGVGNLATAGNPEVNGGLASPRIDLDPATGLFVANIYVGDLEGNMWKFDVSSTSLASWGPAFGSTASPEPLFIARDANDVAQPITTAPSLVNTPQGEVIVLFGTGRFFAVGDNVVSTNPRVETFYAVFDDRSDSVGNLVRADLAQAQIVGETTADNRDFRRIRGADIDFETQLGWYLDLKLASATNGSGERSVSRPSVGFGTLLFTTYEPTTTPCIPGGLPRLYGLDVLTGEPLLRNSNDCQGCGAVELSPGAPVVPPILIVGGLVDTNRDGIPDPVDGSQNDPVIQALEAQCPFNQRPVIYVNPVDQTPSVFACIVEGRVSWTERLPEEG